METCILVLRTNKPVKHTGKSLFVNGVKEVHKERSESWLEPQHIEIMQQAYKEFKDIEGFAKVATKDEVLENSGNQSIQLYVNNNGKKEKVDNDKLYADVQKSNTDLQNSMNDLFSNLREIGL